MAAVAARRAARASASVSRHSLPLSPLARACAARPLHTDAGGSRDARTVGRLKYAYHPEWRPTREGLVSQPAESQKTLFAVEEFGARVLNLNRTHTLNTLDLKLIRSIRAQLLDWESNDIVEVVVLKSNLAEFFCRGGDIKYLYEKARDPATKAEALAYFREEYALSHLIATYTKPLVLQLNGEVMGTSMSMLGRHRVSQENTVFSVPDTARGSVPLGGASYVLGRLERGLGMYLGLTGDALKGEECYWGGLSTVHSSSALADGFLQYVLGRASSTNRSNFSVDRSEVYQRNMAELKQARGAMRYSHMLNEGDATREDMRNYTKLKGWHSFYRRGQFDKGEEWYQQANHKPSDVGELFDFMAPPEMDDYTEPLEPEHHFLWERINHAVETITDLESTSMPAEIAARFDDIAECFAGDPELGDTLLVMAEDPDAALPTRDQHRARLKDQLLPASYETRLSGSLQSLVVDAVVDAGAVPNDLELPALVAVVREQVERTWPYADPSEEVIMQACLEEGLSTRFELYEAVADAVRRVTSQLTGVPTWALEPASDEGTTGGDAFEDLGDLARVDEVQVQAEVNDLHRVHFNITPEDELPPSLPEVTPELVDGVELAAEASVLGVQDAAQEVEAMMSQTGELDEDADDPDAAEALMAANFQDSTHMTDEYRERISTDPEALRGALGMPSTPTANAATKWVVRAIAAEKKAAHGVPQVRSVEEILKRLSAVDSDFARQTKATLEAASPTALKVTHQLITEGSVKTLAECLRMEFQVGANMLAMPDFTEGVSAAIEGRTPSWEHASVADVGSVDSFFAASESPLDLADRLRLFDDARAETAAWEEELTKWYESGEVLGAGSRELRSRFLWM